MNPMINDIYENYGIKVNDVAPLTTITYQMKCENNNCYFIKKTNPIAENKYLFLSNQGVNNVLYPIINHSRHFVTSNQEHTYYISDYVDSRYNVEDVVAYNMFYALNRLHESTSFKRQLSANKTRPKFEELTNQLDYKFRLLEFYVRSLETKTITPLEMKVLENYQFILNAKNEMIRLQKRIILSIKDKESVNFSYIHNNPKLDHLLMNRGSHYLSSLEAGKLGISSLDMAKFYVENQHLNIDFKKIIVDYYHQKNIDFYYDYFRYLVLVIYIKRITIQGFEINNIESFYYNAVCIRKYFELFLDKDEQI